jgi:hypothetical protein
MINAIRIIESVQGYPVKYLFVVPWGKIIKALILMACFKVMTVGISFASHPLITDDAYTQGKGNFQLEIAGEYFNDKDKDKEEKINSATTAVTITYGIAETIDIIATTGYQSIRKNVEGTVLRNDGTVDTGMDVKWRFYEKKNNLFLAIKPGIIFPTGDNDKGLGSGVTRFRFFFISSKELGSFNFHLNLGYMRNNNKNDERKDIAHASLAGEWKIMQKLRLVANTGIETCRDRSYVNDPVFILGGLIYSLTEKIDIDAGIKHGITSTEIDFTVLAGLTMRF